MQGSGPKYVDRTDSGPNAGLRLVLCRGCCVATIVFNPNGMAPVMRDQPLSLAGTLRARLCGTRGPRKPPQLEVETVQPSVHHPRRRSDISSPFTSSPGRFANPWPAGWTADALIALRDRTATGKLVVDLRH